MLKLQIVLFLLFGLVGCVPGDFDRASSIAKSETGHSISIDSLDEDAHRLIQLRERITDLHALHDDILLAERRMDNEHVNVNGLSTSASDIQGLDELLAAYRLQLGQAALEIDQLGQELHHAILENVKWREWHSRAKADIEMLIAHLDQLEADLCIRDNKIDSLQKALNQVYFAWGSLQELRDQGVVVTEKNWLGKPKNIALSMDLNTAYFTKADKRELVEIPIYSKRADVLSAHPVDSYELEKQDGVTLLRILNPSRFWQHSTYLAIVAGN